MAKKLNNPDKAKAWNAFSKYIRVKRCLETMGVPFVGVCITCDRRRHIEYLDAGHCFPGRSNLVLLTEKFVFAQCRECNQVYHGKPKKFEKKMVKKYGAEFVEKWKYKLKRAVPDCAIDWIFREKLYKMKLEKAMHAHGYKTYSELLRQGR
jgi:hypothetical protein